MMSVKARHDIMHKEVLNYVNNVRNIEKTADILVLADKSIAHRKNQ
ncbi:Uncharacterised protein [Yersinia frederiksenii]|nr:Uncharacterised protein [Yersinia frederiksenii]